MRTKESKNPNAAELAGERARTKEIAKEGLPELPVPINKYRRSAAQYRAGVALLWDRERFLDETGWSVRWYEEVQRYVENEDREAETKRDPRLIFSEYKQRQLLCARELEDLAAVFRKSKQFSSLVNAVKARSEIFDRIVKMGQDLGVIEKAGKKVEIDATLSVDVASLSKEELHVHLSKEVAEVATLLNLPPVGQKSGAGAVLRKLAAADRKEREVIDVEAEPKDPDVAKVRRPVSKKNAPRIKRLAK